MSPGHPRVEPEWGWSRDRRAAGRWVLWNFISEQSWVLILCQGPVAPGQELGMGGASLRPFGKGDFALWAGAANVLSSCCGHHVT